MDAFCEACYNSYILNYNQISKELATFLHPIRKLALVTKPSSNNGILSCKEFVMHLPFWSNPY